MSTLRISNIEAKADSSSPTVDEQLRFTNSNGDLMLYLDGRTAGITTVGINTTNQTIKFDANNNVMVTGIITATEFHGSLAVGTSVTYGDNEKAYFGNGLDLELFHDGTNSFIKNTTGNLRIQDSNGNIQEYSPEGEIIIGEGHIGGSLTTSDAGIRAGTRDGVSDNLFSRSVNILETVGDTVRDVTGTVVNVVRDVGVRSYETVGRLGSGVRDVITTGVNAVGGAVKGVVNFIFGNWSQSLPLNPASDIIIDYETLGGASIDPYNPKRSSVVSRSTSLDQDFLIHDIAGINKRVKVNIANQNLGFYDASSETINFASELIKKTALDLSSPSYSREYQDDKSRALEAQYSAPLVKTAWGAMSWEVFYIKCIAYN